MTTRRSLLTVVLAVALLAAAAPPVRAQGSIGFLANQVTTTTAGITYTGLPLGLDWNAPQNVAPSGPWVAGQHPVFALPLDRQDITVETSSDANGLQFVFDFDDMTRVRSDKSPNTPGGLLHIGDKIVIVIDPNNSRESQLQNGPGTATDYRFDITIKNGNVVDQSSIPQDRNTVPPSWDDSSPSPVTIVPSMPSTIGGRYKVTVTIPYSAIGFAPGTNSLASDVGIAFAIINDLGFTYGNPVEVSDLTGVTFPHTMGIDDASEPGFVLLGGTSTGNWASPAQWGTGYAKQSTTNDIHFSHFPQYVWSDSIKLGECGTQTWDDVDASGVWSDQLQIQGWYEYYAGNPCRMKVWLKVKKTQAGAANTRILVVWGRPGIGGSQEWHVVDLTPSISVAPPFHILSIAWPDPPVEPYTLTNHPCLKVFALPAQLDATWTEAKIRAIKTDQDLGDMLIHYQTTTGLALVGNTTRTAQMNFTAVRSTTDHCPANTNCVSLTNLLQRPWQWLTSLVTARPVLASAVTSSNVPSTVAWQPRVDDRREPYKGRPFPTFYRVTAIGIGVSPPKNPRKQYRFLQNLGGIGWAIPEQHFSQTGKMSLEFQVMNPSLFIPVQTKGRVDIVRSPLRDVYLSVSIDAPRTRLKWFPFIRKEARPLVATVRFKGARMEPGQYSNAVIVLTR
jgi:hypothetical protein